MLSEEVVNKFMLVGVKVGCAGKSFEGMIDVNRVSGGGCVQWIFCFVLLGVLVGPIHFLI